MGNIPSMLWYWGVDYQSGRTLPVPWCIKRESIIIRELQNLYDYPPKNGQPGLKVEIMNDFLSLIVDFRDFAAVYVIFIYVY